jgi:hypothetical protein
VLILKNVFALYPSLILTLLFAILLLLEPMDGDVEAQGPPQLFNVWAVDDTHVARDTQFSHESLATPITIFLQGIIKQ